MLIFSGLQRKLKFIKKQKRQFMLQIVKLLLKIFLFHTYICKLLSWQISKIIVVNQDLYRNLNYLIYL